MSDFFTVVGNTLFWALLSTIFALFLGLPLAYLLARASFFGKGVVAAIFSLPLVLPPTAVGYLLLNLFADRGLFGRETLGFDLGIVLTWKAVVVACTVMSMPLVIRTARAGFESVSPRYEGMARTLGYGHLRTFLQVTLPLSARGLTAAAILGFTRSMGEFGATVVLAGNIPGQTQTLASALYSAQQAGNHSLASILLLVAMGVGFGAVFTAEWLAQPSRLNRASPR